MMFSKEKTVVAYTVEECSLCNAKKKRKFQDGDTLFSATTKCSLCDGIMKIEKIFGETIEK